MLHMHIASWAVMLILFVAALVLKNKKTTKIVHMVIRLSYLFVLATGGGMIVQYSAYTGEYIGKAILGVLTIGLIEMILGKKERKQKTGAFMGVFIVVLSLTIVLGLKLAGDLPF